MKPDRQLHHGGLSGELSDRIKLCQTIGNVLLIMIMPLGISISALQRFKPIRIWADRPDGSP